MVPLYPSPCQVFGIERPETERGLSLSESEWSRKRVEIGQILRSPKADNSTCARPYGLQIDPVYTTLIRMANEENRMKSVEC